jgi:hypothetical protein
MLTMLHVDTAVDTHNTGPPVDDLLQVYLGQTSGGRAPAPGCGQPIADAQDLWDYLGDFA